MTLYHVHLYREMRLYFPGIEAATSQEAATIAAGRFTEEADGVQDCNGENLAALVDVAADEHYEHPVAIDFEAERLRKAAEEMLVALRDLYHWLTPDWQQSRMGRQAHAAIAKATGQDGDGRQP